MREEWTAELAEILATMPTAWQQSTAANGFAFDLIRAALRVRAATHRLARAARRAQPTVTIEVAKTFRFWETKTITVPASRTRVMGRCKACPNKNGECRTCNGTGKVDGFLQPKKCDKCGGDGLCSGCNGSGYISGC